jgi:cytochrome c oxidase cbb3-type subunit 4
MIENVINNMGGVGVFGLISICLFFAFFTGMLVWALCLKKPYLNSMRELPLDDDSAHEPGFEPPSNPGDRHDRV